ncbi:hypothetical protein BX285_6880 [Streptomyces sp. 1114.5]|nr:MULTISPECIES: hypothetical protein [unclassified Streptomyces]RKT09776.1 hypothetical protein BX285_6880 [Streptomyces sp. 1114.5]SOB88874.1 hypothetical protein SAMN06272789_7196 [Streptomyces sp. 1331.2]
MGKDEIEHIRTERPTPRSARAHVLPNLDLFVKLCHHLSPNVKD